LGHSPPFSICHSCTALRISWAPCLAVFTRASAIRGRIANDTPPAIMAMMATTMRTSTRLTPACCRRRRRVFWVLLRFIRLTPKWVNVQLGLFILFDLGPRQGRLDQHWTGETAYRPVGTG